ncbi:hypothetical protein TWF106_003108 [Orbilia oligospora]|uniref:Uncharacterized protein n=1 Tax=Orbilia oligospora TaxID=2813651 RepID=A0A7C8UHW5_ORBOL|nr:hypothetical protein TWF106_003108 [Orbilia oligospora]
MTTWVPFRHSILLSVITLTTYSTSVSAFAFGFGPAQPGYGRLATQTTRVDRIDRVSPDYDCYSLIQPQAIRSTDRAQVNPGELQAVEAAITANWEDTAQMDAVAFYTTPDCREDSKALIVRWFSDKKLPQMSYLAAGFEGNRVPRRLTAYRPITIPPGPASEEDYELASVDFEVAILQNPGLMKPGSVFAPRTTRRSSVTYCDGLVRFAQFGERSIRALGGIAKEYFQNNPDAVEVPDDQDLANWPQLEQLFHKELQQLLTGAISLQNINRPRGRNAMFVPGSFNCNGLQKVAYVDHRPALGGLAQNGIEEETEVIQHDEVVLDSDQVNPSRIRAQGNAGRNITDLEEEDDTQYGYFTIDTDSESSEQAASDTLLGSSRERPQGPNLNPSSGTIFQATTAPATSQGQQSEERPRMGGIRGLRAKRKKEAAARSRPGTEAVVNLDNEIADEAEIAPVKVLVSQGNLEDQGFNVRRLNDPSRSTTDPEYETLRASQQADSIFGPIDSFASRQGQTFNTQNQNYPPRGGVGTDLEQLRGVVNLLKQQFFPSGFPALSGSQGQSGNTDRPKIHIPIPRYTRMQEEGVQIPLLAQSIQNSVDTSAQQPSEFLRDLNEIWLEYGGQEPAIPVAISDMLSDSLQPPPGR